MIELPLVFVAGILGTAHCLGMCGPLALAIGVASPGWLSAISRQFAYNAGRVFTYAVLGAIAGYCGSRVINVLPAVVNIPAALAIIAGILLVYQGLRSLGWTMNRVRSLFRRTIIPSANHSNRNSVPAPSPACLAGGMFSSLLRQPGACGALLAGVFTGLMPCSLLYGMLALATSTGSIALGGITMVVFGLGTAPIMILAGLGGQLMSLTTRRWLFAAAAWCLLLTGGISVARGISFLAIADQPAAGCPLCAK